MKAIATFIICLLTSPVLAHNAPSGWKYPGDCCNNEDCRPISCSMVIDLPDGGVDFLNMHFTKLQVKMSGDHQCHVCVSYDQILASPTPVPHCIFLAPTM